MTIKTLDDIAPPARKDYHRLLGLSITLPTEEQRANWNDPDAVRAQLIIEWEPVSYRIEGGPFGNKELDRVNVSRVLTPDERTAVAQFGINGIPAGKINRNKGERANTPFEFLYRALRESGMDITFDDNGQPTSPYIGRVFETENAEREFRWGSTWIRVPIRLADDYAPPDDLPVMTRGGAKPDAQPASAMPAANGTVDVTALKGAIAEYSGASANNVNSLGLELIAKVAHPELLKSEPQQAAREGRLVEWLVEQGAVTVDDGVVVV